MESVPGAVATGFPFANSNDAATKNLFRTHCVCTRSLPLPVLTSYPKLRHYPVSYPLHLIRFLRENQPAPWKTRSALLWETAKSAISRFRLSRSTHQRFSTKPSLVGEPDSA